MIDVLEYGELDLFWKLYPEVWIIIVKYKIAKISVIYGKTKQKHIWYA